MLHDASQPQQDDPPTTHNPAPRPRRYMYQHSPPMYDFRRPSMVLRSLILTQDSGRERCRECRRSGLECGHVGARLSDVCAGHESTVFIRRLGADNELMMEIFV